MKETTNPIANVFKTEWVFLEERKKTFIFYTLFFVIAGIIGLMNPLVIGIIFNKVQDQITTKSELWNLISLIFLLLVIQIVFWIFHGIARVLEQRTGFFVNKNYVNTKVARVLELPIKWHKDHHTGDTIDKVNRGSSAINEFSRGTTFEIFYACTELLGSVIILLFFDIRASILALIFSGTTIYMMYRIDLRLNKQYDEINKFGNKSAARIFDYLNNVITVITLRLKKTVKKEIDTALQASYTTERKNVVLNEVKWATASIAISLMTVIVLSLKAYSDFTKIGTIKVGTLYILYGYLTQVGQTFYRFASLYGNIVRYSSKINNAKTIDEEFKKINLEESPPINEKWEKIEIRNLAYSHDKDGKRTHIDKIDLQITHGQKVAFIGASGSGKSTLLSLLRGLNKPESGMIYIDGKKFDHGLEAVKHSVTLIPQDPEIFNNTLRYNVTLNLPVEEKELNKVIKMARLEGVIEKLPKKLETNVLEKGVSLSGGEKQRLALARGLLAAKDSDIILMDEPTSSVDTLNEIKIYDSIFKEYSDKTIISSLHKLHLLKKFDYIYVFDNGKIIAEGTFNELKETKIFKRIWERYNQK